MLSRARPPFHRPYQSTGVTVNDEAVEAFNAFKLHRAPHDHRYFVYKIENDAEIVVDTFGDKTKSYDDFCGCLPPTECRYGVFDLDYTTLDGRSGNKLIFISWSPDTAKIKNKMVYAASKVCAVCRCCACSCVLGGVACLLVPSVRFPFTRPSPRRRGSRT